MKASLRPCPFCGGEAVVMHMGYGEGYLPEVQTVWGVFCRSDLNAEYQHGHYIDNYATEEEAIAAWNGMWECSKEKVYEQQLHGVQTRS